jgi:hypothetical protein
MCISILLVMIVRQDMSDRVEAARILLRQDDPEEDRHA